jgi:hypothetical protein
MDWMPSSFVSRSRIVHAIPAHPRRYPETVST